MILLLVISLVGTTGSTAGSATSRYEQKFNQVSHPESASGSPVQSGLKDLKELEGLMDDIMANEMKNSH
jgi:hypothetical protein